MIWDAVVVGAGAAGLGAAGELARQGRKVILVEARTRVGGRMWTGKARGREVVELGPEFVHGGNKEFWRMLRRVGVRPKELAMRHWQRSEGAGERFGPADQVWERVAGVMEKLGVARAGGKSLGEVWKAKRRSAGISPADAELMKRFVEGFEAAPWEKMSARAMALLEEEERQFHLPRGYSDLAGKLEEEYLDAGGVLALGRRAVRVRWGRRGVELTTDRGEMIAARAAVVTVPPGTEKEIRFVPALAQRKRLSRKAELGVVRRVTLEMKAGFWRSRRMPLGFVHAPGAEFPTWWTRKPGVTAWRGGPGAKRLAGLSPKEVRRRTVRCLARVLGCGVRELDRQVVECWSHDWCEDPLTRGAYSWARAGAGEGVPRGLSKSIGKVLFFAGEATAEVAELGTVHGAHATGLRAAREVERMLAAKKRSGCGTRDGR